MSEDFDPNQFSTIGVFWIDQSLAPASIQNFVAAHHLDLVVESVFTMAKSRGSLYELYYVQVAESANFALLLRCLLVANMDG